LVGDRVIAPGATGAPRVVLDTNAVLDWIVFDDPRVQPLARAIEDGMVQPITNRSCLAEFQRALGYRTLRLDAEAQRSALGRYMAKVEILEPPPTELQARLPVCADPDDQKFLELAWYAGADWLLTRDRALLELAGRVGNMGRLRILTPDTELHLPGPRS
jgi:putative PIN family toxin of toxin-antitoxin system